ncbi:MAG: hypothetical protein JJ863_30725 [Deltaproteobacteria bacterium]|nr:hypothetical protein [Deltaproteobacteria bacterium]
MRTTILMLALAFAAPAAAQNDNEDVTEHTFDDADDVEGGRNTPWGERLSSRNLRIPRRSLVRPRTNFVDQLMKSVEDM